MQMQTAPVAETLASILAAMVAADGHVDEREMRALDALDAFHRIGVTRDHFADLAHVCMKDIGAGLCEASWLRASHVLYLNGLLDRVPDPIERLLVCRLAAAVITADGRVTHDERLVYEHALAHWNISQTMVSHAIKEDLAALPAGIEVRRI